MEETKLETWAVVEVMGHKRFAGFVSEQSVAGAAFVRVDVPAVDTLPAFTKLLGAASIYAITPCTEETAMAFASEIQERGFHTYEAPRLSVTPRSTVTPVAEGGPSWLAQDQPIPVAVKNPNEDCDDDDDWSHEA